MTALVVALVALAAWGVTASVVALRSDGYRAVPARRP